MAHSARDKAMHVKPGSARGAPQSEHNACHKADVRARLPQTPPPFHSPRAGTRAKGTAAAPTFCDADSTAYSVPRPDGEGRARSNTPTSAPHPTP